MGDRQFVFHANGDEYVIWYDGLHDDGPALNAWVALHGATNG